MTLRRFALVLLALALGAGAALANAEEPAAPRSPDYEKAAKAVKAQDYRGAIDLLNKVVAADPKDADAFNLLGYSYRKLGNLDAALKNYSTALSLNPEHRGAHEYIGEAYLMLNDLPKAKAHLARLDKICWLGCEEYTDLRKAIVAYEAQRKK